MSNFGLFEANVTTDGERQIAADRAADKLAAAVYDVRAKYGPFLFAAKDVPEFRDRTALCRGDMLKTIQRHLPPVAGVMRRVVGKNGAMEKEFRSRLARRQYVAAPDPGFEPGTPSLPTDPISKSIGVGLEHWQKGLNNPFNNQPSSGIAPDKSGWGQKPHSMGPQVGIPNPLQPTGALHEAFGFEDAGNLVGKGLDMVPGVKQVKDFGKGLLGLGEQGGEQPQQAATPASQPGLTGNSVTKAPTLPGLPGAGRSSRRAAGRHADNLNDKRVRGADGNMLPLGDAEPTVARRRRADVGHPMDTDETYDPSRDALEPEGDFHSYLDGVDQDAEGKADGNFVDDGSSQDHDGDPANHAFARRRQAALRTALAVYVDWCDAHNQNPRNLMALDRYADRLSDDHYMALAGCIQRAAELEGEGYDEHPPEDEESGGHYPREVEVFERDSRRRLAKPDQLQKAQEALTNLLNEKAEEFQQGVQPLQQALQTVQQAVQQEQAANPMNVVPPAGTVNVLPQQGDMPPPDPDAAGGAGDPSMMDPSMGGDPGAVAPDQAMPNQGVQARRRRVATGVGDAFKSWSGQNTSRGGEPDVESFFGANPHLDTPRNRKKLMDGIGGPVASRRRADVNPVKATERQDASRNPGPATAFKDEVEDRVARRRRAEFLDDDQEEEGSREDVERAFDDFKDAAARFYSGVKRMAEAGEEGAEELAEQAEEFAQEAQEHALEDQHEQTEMANERIEDAGERGGLGDEEHGGRRARRSRRRTASPSFIGASWGLVQATDHSSPNWDWDNHLEGHVASKAEPFTCKCGSRFDVPAYHHCRCGRTWNAYVIGTGGDRHEASADMFICREIPDRATARVSGRRQAEIYKLTDEGALEDGEPSRDAKLKATPRDWATRGLDGRFGPGHRPR